MKVVNRSNLLDRRRNIKSLKEIYGVKKVVVPSHIADFDYDSPFFVDQNLCKFLSRNPSLSYRLPDPLFFENIIWWYDKTKGVTNIDKSMISYSFGVIFSMALFLEFGTKPNDKVLVNTPAYSPFVKICQSNNRSAILANLPLTDNGFTIDLAKIESLFARNRPKVYIFCNPLNPTGKLWSLAELNAIAKLCHEYKTYFIVDEVHSDLTLLGSGFESALKIDKEYQDRLIVISSPSKGFNLGGTNSNYVITPDEKLKLEFHQYLHNLWLTTPNVFSQELVKTVYSPKGTKWIRQMEVNHEKNYRFLKDYLAKANLPLELIPLQTGFCVAIKMLNVKSADDLAKIKKIFLDNGVIVQFSDDFYDYENFWFRIIISTDLKTMQKLLNGLKKIFK
ncbi:cystathionine beta-lyase [Entomoplasma freundtii]|uniref:cysteine-S-conjugate beta-lyase n=1 Tax=Entomoplasma freundtii TaxID=74700 RepID=A0A2K8NRF2_9MOLU|nr:aminotransferase class I/II-fold pyridoxal phosphate-dependent enzyme [Entomoplasma freundtii]ATZ16425.1 cystathione beta-lyase [Entomoplasma freundtii]TDY56536.1 cystathionine beta-lyase [Entomoplasma freundtii]